MYIQIYMCIYVYLCIYIQIYLLLVVHKNKNTHADQLLAKHAELRDISMHLHITQFTNM